MPKEMQINGMAGNQIYKMTLFSSVSVLQFFYSSWCQKWWRSHKFTFFFSSILFFKVVFSGGVSYQNVHLYTYTMNTEQSKSLGRRELRCTSRKLKSQHFASKLLFSFIFPKILFKMILHWKDFKILYLALEKIISWQFNGIVKYFLCDWN